MASPALRRRSGPVVVDFQAIQSPTTRTRGIGRFASEWAIALETIRPDLVGAYVLDPGLAPPGLIEPLVATGKLQYRGTTQAVPENTRVFHVLSPFDLAIRAESLVPPSVDGRRLLMSAMVFDLIPAQHQVEELADEADRRHYWNRLELLRSCDSVQVLSESTKDAVIKILGMQADIVTTIGAAASSRFRPPTSRQAAEAEAFRRLASMGLRRPFVLYPSGSHPRKNNERLIASFSRLAPELRDSFQLVISGELDASTVHHYEYLAASHGLHDQLVVPGYLDDDRLLVLYQGATLVCFPSLSEGFGLPIVEAFATGTPVVGSNLAPINDLLEPDAQFDPRSEQSMAEVIERALRSPARVKAAAPTWIDVATKSAAAFDELLGRPTSRARSRRTRPKLAFVTPLPPAPSGVAASSYRLLEELARDGQFSIDVYADGRTTTRVAPAGITVRSVPSLHAVERLDGTYEHVVYAFGNSHHHVGALELLAKRPGVVLSHDVRLSNLYRHAHGDPGLAPGGFAAAIRRMYGEGLPEELGRNGELSQLDLDCYGVLMSREVIGQATRFLVTSTAAARLARIEAGPSAADKVEVLSFPIENLSSSVPFIGESSEQSPSVDAAITRLWGKAATTTDGDTMVAHFGIVDRVKGPKLMIEAFRALGRTDCHLAFVGPISEEMAGLVNEQAQELGVADRILLTGSLPSAQYESWLERCTVAIQLRLSSNGEASAAVGDCLASGIPTIVSNTGWFAELPDDAVVKIDGAADGEGLGAVLRDLLDDADRRQKLTLNARSFAADHGYAQTAAALTSLLLDR